MIAVVAQQVVICAHKLRRYLSYDRFDLGDATECKAL